MKHDAECGRVYPTWCASEVCTCGYDALITERDAARREVSALTAERDWWLKGNDWWKERALRRLDLLRAVDEDFKRDGPGYCCITDETLALLRAEFTLAAPPPPEGQ